LLANDYCEESVEIPFIRGTAPTEYAPCESEEEESFFGL